jgi:LuxR family transcriptional activator of conjugal transfer of Ti plasmids
MPIEPWRKFHRFIDAVGVVTHDADFKRCLRTLAHSLGFEHYAYLHIRSRSGFALSNYPKGWQDRYFEQSYQRVDPVIEAVKRTNAPFAWSIENRQFRRQRSRDFSRQADEFGIRCGITIPIPAGFGQTSLLTFASVKAAIANQQMDHAPALAVAALTHAFITLRHPRPSASTRVRLTPQEAICLRWAAEGKSMHETAALLGIKYTSARSYVDNARKKLGAVSLTQAAVLATRLSLI